MRKPFLGLIWLYVFVRENLPAPARGAGVSKFGVNIAPRQGNATLISGFYQKKPNLPKKNRRSIEKSIRMYYI
jgi:hypothetical protein